MIDSLNCVSERIGKNMRSNIIIFPYVTYFNPKSKHQRPLAVPCWKLRKIIVFLVLLAQTLLFHSPVQPRPQPTAQNWFFILWNLGTRHLFSYLCAECTALTSLTITLIGLWQKTTLITIRRYSSCALLNLAECYRIRKLELCLPKACQNINLAWIEPGWGCQRKLLVFSVLLPSNS